MVNVQMLTRPIRALPELAIIGTAEFSAAHQGLEEHDHGPCLEIVVFDRGRNSYTAAGREFSMSGGEFFVTPPRLVHSSGDKPQDKARHAWIQVDLSPSRGRRPFLNSAEGEELRRRLSKVPLMKGRAEPPLYAQLKAIHAGCRAMSESARGGRAGALNPTRALAILDLRTRLIRFLLDFLAAAASARAATAAPATAATDLAARAAHSPAIAHAIAYMQANLAAPLAVRHVAQAAGYTVSAFKQAFRRETGLSPADYFLRLKIDEAKRRLRAGDASITAIAADLGFSSGQYFATAFKRLTTRTPRAFRQAGP